MVTPQGYTRWLHRKRMLMVRLPKVDKLLPEPPTTSVTTGSPEDYIQITPPKNAVVTVGCGGAHSAPRNALRGFEVLSGCFFMLFRVFSCFERYLVAHKGKQRSIAVFSGLERHTTEQAQQPTRHTTFPTIAPVFGHSWRVVLTQLKRPQEFQRYL